MDEFSKLDMVSRFAVQSVVKIAKLTCKFERRYVAGVGAVCARPVPRGVSWEINSSNGHEILARGVIAR